MKRVTQMGACTPAAPPRTTPSPRWAHSACRYWFLVRMATATNEPQEVRDYFNWRAWTLRSGSAFCSECVK